MGSTELEKQWDKRLRKLGVCVETVDREARHQAEGGSGLTELRFNLVADEGTSVLCILKRSEGADKYVAFVGASCYSECLLAVARKLAANAVRWRVDVPWDGP